MRRSVAGVPFVIAVWCAGCASQPAATLASAVAPGQAKISITRSSEGPFATVHIAVNGAQTVDLGAGQTYTGGVQPGSVSLTASQSLDIGEYTVRFNAVPGKQYAFLVSERGDRLVAGVLGGLPALAIDTAVNGEQSGAFKITPVPQ